MREVQVYFVYVNVAINMEKTTISAHDFAVCTTNDMLFCLCDGGLC